MSLTFSIALAAHIGFQANYETVIPHVRYQHDDKIIGAIRNSEGGLGIYFGFDEKYYEYGIIGGYNSYALLPYFRAKYEVNDFVFFVSPTVEEIETEQNTGLVLGIEYKF